MKVQLSISVSDLADPQASYYASVSKGGDQVGQTRPQKGNATYSELVLLDEEATVEVKIHSASDHAVVAQQSFDVSSIIHTYTQATARSSEQGPNIAVHATEQTNGKLALTLQGHDLPNLDFGLFRNQKTDPIYEIYNYLGKKVARSNKVEDNLDPVWNEAFFDLESLCGTGKHRLTSPLRITVMDRDSGDTVEYIGNLTMTVDHMIKNGSTKVPLVRGGSNVGKATLSVKHAELLPEEVVPHSAKTALLAALSAIDNLEALKEQAAAQQDAAEAARVEAETAQAAAQEKIQAADALAAQQLGIQTQFSELAKLATETDKASKDRPYAGQCKMTLSCQDLPDTDFGIRNKTDAIYQVFLGTDMLFRSNKVDNNLDPVWDETSVDLANIASLDDTKLKIVVSDKDGKESLTKLGLTHKSINEILEDAKAGKLTVLEEQYKNAKAKLKVNAASLDSFKNLPEEATKLRSECEALQKELEAATQVFSTAQKEANDARNAAADAAELAARAMEVAQASKAAVENAEKSL